MNFIDSEDEKLFGQIEPFIFKNNTDLLNSPQLLNDLVSFDMEPSLHVSPSSSVSSLSFAFDHINTNSFLAMYDSNLNHQSTPSCCSNNFDCFNLAKDEEKLHLKQDVSCGTETTSDLKPKKESNGLKLSVIDCKKVSLITSSISNTSLNMNPNVLPKLITNSATLPINSANAFNLFRKQSNESFKLIEKIQPKKTRTKYTKEQLFHLEEAFQLNAYPEIPQIENLCKTIDISKEKINIWFQNRRARGKRNGCCKIKNFTPSLNTSTTSFSQSSNQSMNSISIFETSISDSSINQSLRSSSSSSSSSLSPPSTSTQTFWSANMSSFVTSAYDI